MDEILYDGSRPQEEAAPAPQGLSPAEKQHRRAERLYRWDSFWASHRPRAVPFLLIALLAGGLLIAQTVYTRGYAVAVNGQTLGVVADPADFEAIVARVEGRVEEILGRPYTLPATVAYTPEVVEKRALSTMYGFESYLFSQVPDVTRGYTFSIDGEVMGKLKDAEAVNAILDELKAPYINAHTVSSDFTVPVELVYDYTANEGFRDGESFRELLTSNTIEAATYTVVAGDTYSEIAYDRGMSLDELMEMNPQASLSSLYVGDVLTVRQSVPYLSVRTVDKLTYEEAIPAPVEYVEDDTMYQGDSKVLEPGSDGLARVTAAITYINGAEDSREVLNSVTLTEPTLQVVVKGTKERPRTMPTGHFIWPVYGTITSEFKYRSLFGTYKFHSGIDIAVAHGTPVKAADGGTVTYAGWDNSGYGNLVVINHGNGKESYYAHNSAILVSVGSKVYQGQTIAKVGSTGRSTGPHCHFEVRINGQRVNPRNYLP